MEPWDDRDGDRSGNWPSALLLLGALLVVVIGVVRAPLTMELPSSWSPADEVSISEGTFRVY